MEELGGESGGGGFGVWSLDILRNGDADCDCN